MGIRQKTVSIPRRYGVFSTISGPDRGCTILGLVSRTVICLDIQGARKVENTIRILNCPIPEDRKLAAGDRHSDRNLQTSRGCVTPGSGNTVLCHLRRIQQTGFPGAERITQVKPAKSVNLVNSHSFLASFDS